MPVTVAILISVAAGVFAPLPEPACSRRDAAIMGALERSAAADPSSLLLQVSLAGCYDQAWQFQSVGPAIAKAILILDAEPPAPDTGAPRVVRPVAGADVPVPRRTRDKQAEYPREASAAGLFGFVVLEIVIDAHGAVSEAAAVKSVPGLDEAALKAARQWKFAPTVVGGTAIEVLGYVPVRFGPTNEPAASDWLEVAVFHYRKGERDRARTALKVALSLAQTDMDRFGGYADTEVKGTLAGFTRPTVKKQVDPRYPRRSMSSNAREGTVTIEALVDRLGNIGRPRIVGASSQFDGASMEAALQWRFTPALKEGKPVPSRIMLQMDFARHSPSPR